MKFEFKSNKEVELLKSNLLKAERVKMGINQTSLAKALKIDVSTYSKKENGIIQFKTNEISTIKKNLNLSPEEIAKIFFE